LLWSIFSTLLLLSSWSKTTGSSTQESFLFTTKNVTHSTK
jgi:hypothetical protein